jgi:hypothetical protein
LQGPPKFTQIWIFGLKLYVASGNPGLCVVGTVWFRLCR